MKLTIKQKRFADDILISGNAYGLVYKITNTINNKCYIGITTRTLEQRFEEHCESNSAIGKAIKKYGREHFVKEIIEYANNRDELMNLEIKYIAKYDSYKKGYNQTLGGDGVNICPDLELNLTNEQQKYLKFVKAENEKTINVNDNDQMVRMLLINLIGIYLTVKKIKDKISVSKLILRLKPNFLRSILDTQVMSLEEIKHYSHQRMSSFEVFING